MLSIVYGGWAIKDQRAILKALLLAGSENLSDRGNGNYKALDKLSLPKAKNQSCYSKGDKQHNELC